MQYLKAIRKSIMATQNYKNICQQKLFFIFECLLPQKPSNPISQLSWFSRPYGRLLENQKIGGSKELFLPENDYKNCSAENFPTNMHILEAWKPTEDMNLVLNFFRHMPFYIWTHYNIKIVLAI